MGSQARISALPNTAAFPPKLVSYVPRRLQERESRLPCFGRERGIAKGTNIHEENDEVHDSMTPD